MYKIIIVDDEAAVRNNIKKNINWAEFGFELVDDCEDGRKAINSIDEKRPDVVLTDICMPSVDGIELAKYITAKYPNIKIIIITGYDEFSYAQQAIKLNVIDFILKPITPKELKNLLTRIRTELDEEFNNIRNLSKLKMQLNESLPILKNRFLNGIINGQALNENIYERLSSLNIKLNGKYFLALNVDADDFSESGVFVPKIDDELVCFAMANICDEIIGSYGPGVAFQNDSGHVTILLSGDSKDSLSKNAYIISDVLRENIAKNLRFTITIGIGTICTDIKKLYISFNNAVTALHFRFVQGRNRVIDIKDMDVRTNEIQQQNMEYINRLKTELKIGTTSQVDTLIKSIFSDLKSNYTTIENSYLYIQIIIVSIMSVINEMGYDESEVLPGKESPLSEIYKLKTLDEIEQSIGALCHRITNLVSTKREDLNKIQAIRAEDYIHNNYYKEDISLNSICKHLLLSTTYFSINFKQHTGVTFVEYLTNVRVKKAMEFLKGTNLKTYEIANKVGYNDAHYFSSIFKKATGMTPSEYREKTLENANG